MRSLLAVCSLLGVLGCGNGETPLQTYPLTGTVTLDGKPIPTASILLKDPIGQLRSCVATVQDGVIRGESTAGEKEVEITAYRIAEGKTIPGADGTGTEPATEQYLPAKYNSESTLTVTIAPKKNVAPLTFDLQSKTP